MLNVVFGNPVPLKKNQELSAWKPESRPRLSRIPFYTWGNDLFKLLRGKVAIKSHLRNERAINEIITAMMEILLSTRSK